MPKTYICPTHQSTNQMGHACPQCLSDFAVRRPADEMTPDERMAEMQGLRGTLTMPFSNVHERIEELVGRSVWTHEIGMDFGELVREAGHRLALTMDEIINLIPPEKRVIISREEHHAV